jgi:L-threonylcarbamoyladenylate synthase
MDTRLIHETPDAARLIRAGGLVAFPTETVYGLGADATNADAVARLYAAKGRPAHNPLIVHVTGADEAFAIGRATPDARRLAAAFWPGPLTLVLARREPCPVVPAASAGTATVALRVPRHPLALALLQAAGVPVAAPSANRSGRLSPTRAAHVLASLGGRIDAVLDGGPTEVGLESTVIACLGGHVRLLRPGAVTLEQIEAALGRRLEAEAAAEPPKPLSPGQLASHYAPRARLRLAATQARPGEALLAFGPAPLPHTGPMVNLSPSGDLAEAARTLFEALHRLDATGVATIAVMNIPETGLGYAIRDRLNRAAAERPAVTADAPPRTPGAGAMGREGSS